MMVSKLVHLSERGPEGLFIITNLIYGSANGIIQNIEISWSPKENVDVT